MLCMILFNLLTAPRAERMPPPARFPKVSLLVPARNEAHNLPVLAEHLARLEYPDLEIILLDDASEDGTAGELNRLVTRVHSGNARTVTARALRGAPLPAGWLGKNWACHKLAQAALGEVLVFCDADARPGPQAVARTVSLLERYDAGCATFMPRQLLGTWSERAVIPVLLHLTLLGFFPLALAPRLRWKRLGVANGQWLSFRRTAYDAMGGHAAVRAKVVEDIALAQRAQVLGQGLAIALAPRTLEVRMYRSFPEVWNGFGKNLFVLTGGSPWSAPLYGAFFTLFQILPWAMLLVHPSAWAAPFALLVACRLLVAAVLREPLAAIAWHVAGSLLVPVIAARSLWNFRRGRLSWKGRVLDAGERS
ncbi:MAG TPA: glycosyltransferase family 2 protein [Fibrobacteria bacterium]|nr:glycosyltransferase family 2 protein [Fibrobacteria bacterium]